MSQRPRLILAAHGAVDSPRSNQPIEELAQRILASGRFDAVSPAFLNGDPLMSNVLDRWQETLADEHCEEQDDSHRQEVIVVPVMTSEGYYLKKLPEQFQQNRHADKFLLRMTPVVGMHSRIPVLMAERIRNHMSDLGIEPGDTTIVIVGHGTRRNPDSGTSTFELTEAVKTQLATTCSGLTFATAFLDQDPELGVVARAVETRHAIAMPFLISLGPHMTEDVPAAFGLPTGPMIEFPLKNRNDLRGDDWGVNYCDGPLGMYPELADIVLEMASE